MQWQLLWHFMSFLWLKSKQNTRQDKSNLFYFFIEALMQNSRRLSHSDKVCKKRKRFVDVVCKANWNWFCPRVVSAMWMEMPFKYKCKCKCKCKCNFYDISWLIYDWNQTKTESKTKENFIFFHWSSHAKLKGIIIFRFGL